MTTEDQYLRTVERMLRRITPEHRTAVLDDLRGHFADAADAGRTVDDTIAGLGTPKQIAERAAVNRTVVYRYFRDRADLDLAIQQAIVAQLWERLLPAVTLDGTVPQIIDRIIGTYVDWAVHHPALHHVVDHDYGSGALEQALDEIATEIGGVISFAITAFGGKLAFDEDELDPLMHGLVGAVFGSVRRWLNRPAPVLSAERLQATVSQSVWFVLEGHARIAGVELDPERTVAELLEAAAGVTDAADTVAP